MTAAELKAQAELMKKIQERLKRRRTVGVSGQDCETEYKTGSEVCISVTNLDLNCSQAILGEYYDRCEVDISYSMETDYRGNSYLDVDIECEATISRSGQNMFSSTDSESESKSIDLYAHDFQSGSIELDFRFSPFSEIKRVRIQSAECKIRDVNLY